ncbi:hypothetical protein QTP88_001111 [Uroleucon formosanum]
MFKTNNQPHNLYVLTNHLKVNLLEAIKMLKNPNKVSSAVECLKLEPQPGKWYIFIEYNQTKLMSDGIEWQATGTNLLPSEKKPIVQVEYFASENLYKSIFKLTRKYGYNAILVNYASNLDVTDPPEIEIQKPQFVSRKRSMRNIMKDRFKIFKKSINQEIVNNQPNIGPIRNINFNPHLGADYSLPEAIKILKNPNKVSSAVECSKLEPQPAWDEMKKAGEEERRLAIESGSLDVDGTPIITVVADGQWSKQSYKINQSQYGSRKIQVFVDSRQKKSDAAVGAGEKKKDVALRFGIPASTLSTILKQKDHLTTLTPYSSRIR